MSLVFLTVVLAGSQERKESSGSDSCMCLNPEIIHRCNFFSSVQQLPAVYFARAQVVNCGSGRKNKCPDFVSLFFSLPLALAAPQEDVLLRAVQAALPAPSHLCAEVHQVRGALQDGVRGALRRQRLREAVPRTVCGGLPNALCHPVHHVLQHPVCGSLSP